VSAHISDSSCTALLSNGTAYLGGLASFSFVDRPGLLEQEGFIHPHIVYRYSHCALLSMLDMFSYSAVSPYAYGMHIDTRMRCLHSTAASTRFSRSRWKV
jgi:hypothetical protein